MFQRLIKNDLKQNKLTILVIALFLLLSMTFSLSATRLATSLSSSISHFLAVSKSPHLLQMHKGQIDRERLAAFVKRQSAISRYQIVDFVNIEGADIKINGKQTLQDSGQDNGFSSQNQDFDLLLNEQNKPAQPKTGEIYIPLFYYSNKSIKIGDTLSIKGLSFRVKGFVRDPQMNAGLVSSKRFLVHPADLAKLKEVPNASLEYLIEFRLKKLSQVNKIQQAYLAENLESNGPPMIPFSTIQIINGINDALLILVLASLCLALIFITFLCMHFALLTKIEEDLQQIAVMKVMGLPYPFIKRVYLAKYYCISLLAIGLAWGLAFFLTKPLSQNLLLSTGVSQRPIYSIFLELAIALLLSLILLGLAGHPLKTFKKMTPTDALALAKAGQKSKKKSSFYLALPKSPAWDSLFFSLKMVFSHARMYLTMFVIISLTGLLVLLPTNLAHTLSNQTFIEHLGVGRADMLIDISQTDDIDEKAQTLMKELKADKDIDRVSLNSSQNFQTKDKEGKDEKIRVSLGDHNIFPIKYIEGRTPNKEGEIALSALKSQDLQLKLGDSLPLTVDGKKRQLKVVGIYSDLTYGGKTAKANFPVKKKETLNSLVALTFKPGLNKASKIKELKQRYSTYRATDTADFIQQTLGSTIATIESIQKGLFWVGIFILFILVTLFVYLLVTKNRADIALFRILGFSHRSIRRHYLLALSLITLLSLGFSLLLLVTIGQSLCNLLFSSFGVSRLELSLDYGQTFFIIPLALLGSGLLAAHLSLRPIHSLKIARYLKE